MIRIGDMDGMLALDDVAMSYGRPCSPLGSCDFEEGWCLLQNLETDDFDWILHQGRNPNGDIGPEADATTGTSTGERISIIFFLRLID